jgi:putative protein-disulfide isomerase
MCSWCYAFDIVLKKLELDLPDSICLIKIVGGLAPDSTEPMQASLINTIQKTWQQIEKTMPQIQFNYAFWNKNQPIRSTYPACRAVLAAKKQSLVFENKMIQQIQWTYYKNAENPSLDTTLIKCAKQIGLEVELFKQDYSSQALDDKLKKEIKFSRLLGVSSYPSLCLELNKQVLPIKIDYNNADSMLEQLLQADYSKKSS